ncbi:MAG: GNAT family N-acetyltransferase [Atopobiaceae bacterium]
MIALELAAPEDLDLCYEIVDDGRKFQREPGFVQWTDGYPSRDTIRHDIESHTGYVLRSDGAIAGYMCVDFSGVPAYEHIEGAWSADMPYAVVHRLALSRAFRGIGLMDTAFTLIERLCLQQGVSYMRADTDFPNKRMQHVLEKSRFVQCGTIVFQGSGKLAYDKVLSEELSD